MHKLLVRYFTFCLSQLRQNSKNTIDWVLKQQTLTSHSSGGWEVQDQGAGRSGVWWEPASQFADGWLLTGLFWQVGESEL